MADLANEVTHATAGVPTGLEGTIPYLAPEAIRGETQDERSDLWSLGIVFYELVTGRLPFAGPNGLALIGAILHESPRPLPDSVPPSLAALIHRLLSKDPARRYGTAAEVAAALATATAAVESSPAHGTQPGRRRTANRATGRCGARR